MRQKNTSNFKYFLAKILRYLKKNASFHFRFLESSDDVEILSKSEDSGSSTHPCGPSLHDDEFLTNFSFVCSGVLVLIVGSLGLMCNGLTCLTLKMMSKSMTLFNKLLLTLAIVDSCFILSGGALMTKHSFGWVLESAQGIRIIKRILIAVMTVTFTTDFFLTWYIPWLGCPWQVQPTYAWPLQLKGTWVSVIETVNCIANSDTTCWVFLYWQFALKAQDFSKSRYIMTKMDLIHWSKLLF